MTTSVLIGSVISSRARLCLVGTFQWSGECLARSHQQGKRTLGATLRTAGECSSIAWICS